MSRRHAPATAAELDALQLPLPSVEAHDPGDEDRTEAHPDVVMLPTMERSRSSRWSVIVDPLRQPSRRGRA